ncbi:hypothetical protein [Hyalangium versicolor]|uniref:hypothetical protein n=1 Tax=Hyalangium versicolor TaxID=2861190 RepID=UPI001CCD0273|nr:hypothetical protein [Hyalangium versicolor]
MLINPRVLSTLLFLSLCLAASPAVADDPVPRYSLGLSTGFGHPLGLLQGGDGHEDQPLRQSVSGIIPAQLDLGLFLTSRVYLGTSLQYSRALLANGCPPRINEDCSALGLRLGATLSYHLPESNHLSPWFGLGTGYELLRPADHSFHGLELFNVQAGADLHVGGPLWLRPFAMFSIGLYLNVNDAQQHSWLMGGLRLSLRQEPEKNSTEETPQGEIIASSRDSVRGLDSRATRIPAGILAGTLAGAVGAIPGAFLMFQRYCLNCEGEYIGLALAVGGATAGSALGIDYLGSTLGGHGHFAATVVGTLLGTLAGITAGFALAPTVGAAAILPAIVGPAMGGVIAYEISHAIAIGETFTRSRPRYVPLVSASPRGRVIGGLAGRF